MPLGRLEVPSEVEGLKASGPDYKTRRNGPEPVEGFVERRICSLPLQPQKTMAAWLYVLRLKSGQLYVGATKDLDHRCSEHFEGKACQTTKFDPPIALVHSEEYETHLEARRREAQVKRWSRAKKEALVSGEVVKLKELLKSRENG